LILYKDIQILITFLLFLFFRFFSFALQSKQKNSFFIVYTSNFIGSYLTALRTLNVEGQPRSYYMQDVLKQYLYGYIRDNHPDLLFRLEDEGRVAAYLNERLSTVAHLLSREGIPDHIMEEECMEILTADLKFSKYQYIAAILEEEFAVEFEAFTSLGVLQTEIVNMIAHCFDGIELNESNEADNFLRYSIIGAVAEYLARKRENETVKYGIPSSREVSG